ncbi:MAG: hypothetical protein DSY46_01585 [Hydrogenimonas sp.]|nr:MAG: hypothetical protein DSY46_01585 [Hydrogenimonas sp.]
MNLSSRIGKNIFIYYTVHNKTYTTIYGSFSTLLFFMLWIYISWIIFLYGQKLCYLLNQVDQPTQRKSKLKIECDTPPNRTQSQSDKEDQQP